MCQCIKDIETKALENFTATGRYKKPIQAVSLTIGFPVIDGKLLARTYSNMEVTLDGQKKRESVAMFHTYCPFCGAKYEN